MHAADSCGRLKSVEQQTQCQPAAHRHPRQQIDAGVQHKRQQNEEHFQSNMPEQYIRFGSAFEMCTEHSSDLIEFTDHFIQNVTIHNHLNAKRKICGEFDKNVQIRDESIAFAVGFLEKIL